MGRVTGKTAFITGGARGQGRAHALRLAEEGANVVVVDQCGDVDTVPYPLATSADLAETVRLVAELGGKAVSVTADVRDHAAMEDAARAAVAAFGTIDIVCANAGVTSYATSWEMPPAQWQAVIDINLTGVWNTTRACIPAMIEQGTGGSIIITSSTGGLYGIPNAAHYCAAKHGVVGLARTMAQELASYSIRVNTLHPTGVSTKMVHNDFTYSLFLPDTAKPTFEEAEPTFKALNLLPVGLMDPRDVSNAVLWLASDEARWVTGISLPVDAGSSQKMPS